MLHYLPVSLLAICLLTTDPAVKETSPTIAANQKSEEPRTVMVMPVDYFYFTWDEWGLPNDYLQEKLIADLGTAFPEKFRFYTESQINEMAINPDLVIQINFSDITIGKPKASGEDYGRGSSLKTISSPSTPPNSLYTSNKSSFNFTTVTIENKAKLNSVIFNWATDDTLMKEEVAGLHQWEGNSTEFRTRNEAIRELNTDGQTLKPNKNLIESPGKDEFARKLMDICYKKAFKKIKLALEQNN